MDKIIKIFKLDLEQAQKIANLPNEPHSHDFEELLIGTKGLLEHFIDFHSEIIEAPFVSFVTQGKIHRVKPMPKDGQCDIWSIRFKAELIAETTFQLYSVFHDNANIPMKMENCFNRINILCELMYQEYNQDAPDIAVLRQLLSAIFAIIESDRRKLHLNDNETNKIKSNTFRNLLKLLNIHFKEAHDVNFYADKLFMSTRNLNNICQAVLGQSVSEIVENRKLTEAKNLLMTTELTVSEVGYEIGYKENTNFTHAFKRKTGITPTDFRKEMIRIIS